MAKITFGSEPTMSRYPTVGSRTARDKFSSGYGTVADTLHITLEPKLAATAVYVGLVFLRNLKASEGQDACALVVQEALAELQLDEGDETVNAAYFTRHKDFIRNRCAGLFPRVKAMDSRTGALALIGCRHFEAVLAEPDDDWMEKATFNS